MIDNNISNKISEIVDNYLKDDKTLEEHNERNVNRKIISENEIKPLCIKLFKDKIKIDEFKTKNDGLNKKHNLWGFKGIAGAMFFNQLFNAEDDKERLEKEIKRYLLEPNDINAAKLKIDGFSRYVKEVGEKIELHYKSPAPKASIFFLSYFWHIQAPDKYPIFYPKSRKALKNLGLIDESRRDDYGDLYIEFLLILQEIYNLIKVRMGKTLTFDTIGNILSWYIDETKKKDVWSCPKESCAYLEIELTRNDMNVIDSGSYRKIIIHFLQHLGNENIYFSSPDIYDIFLDNCSDDVLSNEETQTYPSRHKIWKNQIRSTLGSFTKEGYLETDDLEEIPEIYNKSVFEKRKLRTRKRTEKFFEEFDVYNDWILYDFDSENDFRKEKLLFCRTGWMKYYKGISEDDNIVRGGSYIKEYRYGSEILNFNPAQGYYYGFVQANADTIDITRLGASGNQESIDGVNVIWGATLESGGQMIYGWYKNAKVYRKRQTPSVDLNRLYDGNFIYYNIKAKIGDCHLLPVEERDFQVPHAGKEESWGMGQSNVWYAQEEVAKEYRKTVLKFINKVHPEKSGSSDGKKKDSYRFPERKLLSFNLINSGEIDKVKNLLLKYKQIILYGPPGTGKTYFAQIIAQELTNNKYQIIQFHPSYAYEDFVEWIEATPSKDGNNVIFKAQPRIFRNLCDYADNSKKNVVLIIDEINRGDIGRVFGELILGLESSYRNMEINTPLSNKLGTLKIPNNLYIIGTMNSVDRSIAIMDYALRRRFLFYLFMPDRESLIRYLNTKNVLGEELKKKILNLFTNLNEEISNDRKLGKHYQIGHTYFFVESEDELKTNWSYMIKPLLEEYFNFNEEDLSEYIYDNLIQKRE